MRDTRFENRLNESTASEFRNAADPRRMPRTSLIVELAENQEVASDRLAQRLGSNKEKVDVIVACAGQPTNLDALQRIVGDARLLITPPGTMRRAKRFLAAIAFTAVRPYLRYSHTRIGQKMVWNLAQAYLAHYDFRRMAIAKSGAVFACSSNDLVQSYILCFGEWEPALTEFLSYRLRPTDVFVDVGAHVGYFTLLASRLVGPFGTVVAIDASVSNFLALRDNIKLNNVGNVRAVHAAVWDTRGSLVSFAGDPGNSGHASVIAEHGMEVESQVDSFPLGDLLTEEEWKNARVIKIDVEGAESNVLRGILAGPELSRNTELVVEISPDWLGQRGQSADTLLDAFRSRGYYVYELARRFPWERRTGPLLREVRGGMNTVADVILSRTPKLDELTEAL
jgi:FkbM family methyltransferase